MFHSVCCDQFLILELGLYRIRLSKTSLVLDGIIISPDTQWSLLPHTAVETQSM